MDDIREELEELDIQNYEQKPFIAHDALHGLLNESKITLLVKNLSDQGQIQVYQQQEIITSILRNGLRLFATLLSLSRPELIVKFIETDHFAHVMGYFDGRRKFIQGLKDIVVIIKTGWSVVLTEEISQVSVGKGNKKLCV